jgi:hypothetical protein
VIAVSGRPPLSGRYRAWRGRFGGWEQKRPASPEVGLFFFVLQQAPGKQKGIARRDAFDRHPIAESGIT